MILEKETYEKFGYYPSDLKPQSGKLIITACDDCGKIRVLSKQKYRPFCHSCSVKEKRNPNYSGGKIKINCDNCGKIIEEAYWEIERSKHHFCNLKCCGQWQSKDKESREHLRKIRRIMKPPTRPELIFEDICSEKNLPFKYTGDGSLWIGKKGRKQLNPDFIEANGKKICVEIMGAWWHSPLLSNKNLRESAILPYREKHYKKYKWIPIFIWDTDLLRKDAEQFILNELKKQRIM